MLRARSIVSNIYAIKKPRRSPVELNINTGKSSKRVKTDQITTRHVESTTQKWYFGLLTTMLARKVNCRMFQLH
jgi:hypothetical protein